MLRKIEEKKYRHWFKLDNAAKIYPAANTRRWSGMFRLSVTLNEKIDPVILQEALVATIKRFPSFNIRMGKGIFWYYFESNIRKRLQVKPDINNPCAPIRWKDNNGFLLRVFYYDKRIAIDFFHSLTDGTGAMVFLKTLTARYLTLKGYEIPTGEGILDVEEKPDKEEYEDSFVKYANSRQRGRPKEPKAYHMKGTGLDDLDISIITGIVSLEKIKQLAKEHHATITEYLAAILLYSFYKQKEKEGLYKKPTRIAVSIPVNLRNYFKSNTKRNFSTFLNPGIDTILGEYTMEEMLRQIQYFMKANLNDKVLNAMMTQNVILERNLFIRIVPLFLKNFLMSIAHDTIGYRPITTVLSNIGIVTVPPEMKEHVNRFELVLGAAKIRTPYLAVVSYDDTLVLNFTSKIKETDIERTFFTYLIKQGVQVKIESNRE
ncbi:MAG TPA: alcohol acetyltransferase [Clostridia bacterium]|jgi:NRPS condensation-like uncharacterized protein|nr:alcohol acetyltransferase [Clostridia bacterium]HQC67684.1 alcohol acetyltransferase [Clostridia bacterium]